MALAVDGTLALEAARGFESHLAKPDGIVGWWRPLKIFRAPPRLARETDAAIGFARTAECLFANDFP